MSRFLFLVLLTMSIAAMAGGRARSQFVGYVAPGSTAPGDYLRGVGIEAAGMGMYNWNTAVAESIHANTSIRVDQYVREVLREGRVQYATQRKEQRDRFDANYAAIRKRISEHPEAIDLMSGRALNDALDKLDDPMISESAFRQSQGRLSIEDIRKITFKLGEKGASFSRSASSPPETRAGGPSRSRTSGTPPNAGNTNEPWMTPWNTWSRGRCRTR